MQSIIEIVTKREENLLRDRLRNISSFSRSTGSLLRSVEKNDEGIVKKAYPYINRLQYLPDFTKRLFLDYKTALETDDKSLMDKWWSNMDLSKNNCICSFCGKEMADIKFGNGYFCSDKCDAEFNTYYLSVTECCVLSKR